MWPQLLVDALVVLAMFVVRIGVPLVTTLGLGYWLEKRLRPHEESEETEMKVEIARRDHSENAQAPGGEREDDHTQTKPQDDERDGMNFSERGFGRGKRRAPDKRGDQRFGAAYCFNRHWLSTTGRHYSMQTPQSQAASPYPTEKDYGKSARCVEGARVER
jgi:hypothetical protein